MEIKIIAEASTKFERYSKGWGLSVLIDNDLLFDTFSNERILKKNIKKLNIDINKIKYVVISHEHWDHTGGLWWILENTCNIKVFLCKGFSDDIKTKIKSFGAEIIEVENSIQIKDNIFTTGQMECIYKEKLLFEQALIINKGKNIVITGCSHPGIINILKKVRSLFPQNIRLVLGGFHLLNKSESQILQVIEELKNNYNIEEIAPCHCTGKTAENMFKKYFKDKYVKAKSKTIIYL